MQETCRGPSLGQCKRPQKMVIKMQGNRWEDHLLPCYIPEQDGVYLPILPQKDWGGIKPDWSDRRTANERLARMKKITRTIHKRDFLRSPCHLAKMHRKVCELAGCSYYRLFTDAMWSQLAMGHEENRHPSSYQMDSLPADNEEIGSSTVKPANLLPWATIAAGWEQKETKHSNGELRIFLSNC